LAAFEADDTASLFMMAERENLDKIMLGLISDPLTRAKTNSFWQSGIRAFLDDNHARSGTALSPNLLLESRAGADASPTEKFGKPRPLIRFGEANTAEPWVC
jgi:hypothetical protein